MQPINIFEVKDIEKLWDDYLREHKQFYRVGDARDYIPIWEEYRPKTMTEDAQHYFDELKEQASKIEEAGEDHRLSMQRHESGEQFQEAVANYGRILGE